MASAMPVVALQQTGFLNFFISSPTLKFKKEIIILNFNARKGDYWWNSTIGKNDIAHAN